MRSFSNLCDSIIAVCASSLRQEIPLVTRKGAKGERFSVNDRSMYYADRGHEIHPSVFPNDACLEISFVLSLSLEKERVLSLFFVGKRRERKGREQRDSSVRPFRCPLRAGRHTRPFGNSTYRTATWDSREKSIRRFLRQDLTGRRLRKAPIRGGFNRSILLWRTYRCQT